MGRIGIEPATVKLRVGCHTSSANALDESRTPCCSPPSGRPCHIGLVTLALAECWLEGLLDERRRFRSASLAGKSRWRDPDLNRGHHDFQA